jgi:hypothetical protein
VKITFVLLEEQIPEFEEMFRGENDTEVNYGKTT